MNIGKYLVAALLFSVAAACEANYETERSLGLEHEAKFVMVLKKGVPSAEIKTHAYKGILQIAGYVNNRKEYDAVVKAIDECLKQEANKIINDVKIYEVKSCAERERALVKLVLNHLKQDDFPLKGVSVQAKGNHILLSGFISKYIDANQAVMLVKKVPGVTAVDNCLLYKH